MTKQNPTMLRFLADLNISPKTVAFLTGLGIDIVRIDKRTAQDEEVVLFAKKEKRIILTFDKDFGEIYYFYERGIISVIVLSLNDQRCEYVNRVLQNFLTTVDRSVLIGNLVILYEDRYRFIRQK